MDRPTMEQLAMLRLRLQAAFTCKVDFGDSKPLPPTLHSTIATISNIFAEEAHSDASFGATPSRGNRQAGSEYGSLPLLPIEKGRRNSYIR